MCAPSPQETMSHLDSDEPKRTVTDALAMAGPSPQPRVTWVWDTDQTVV